MKSTIATPKLNISARGYQRKRRISRFKKRDRSKEAPIYAPAPSPAAAGAPADVLKFHVSSLAPKFADCLNRTRGVQIRRHLGRWAVVTIASPGFESQANDFFTTLERYGEVREMQRVLLCVEMTADLVAVAAAHGALAVPLRAVGDVDASIKAAIYSAGRLLWADHFLCFDSDVFVVEDLRPLLRKVEQAPKMIHAALSATATPEDDPTDFILTAQRYYKATSKDAISLLDGSPPQNFNRLNSGVVAGGKLAFIALDLKMRDSAEATNAWIQAKRSPAADELAFSLAVARLGGAQIIDERWNLQLYAKDVFPLDLDHHAGGNWPHFDFWHGDERAAVLHFAAKQGREKLPHFRQLLALDKGS
jgi:hypothetical protein